MQLREANCHASAPRAKVVLFALMGALLFLASVSQSAQSQTYRVIHNFTDKKSDRATPYGGLILDRSGNLYGASYLGGLYANGSVYRLVRSGDSWTYSSLYSFKGLSEGVKDGSGPGFGSLVMGADGLLFGTTESGGYFGTDFAVCDCPGKEVVIHQFGIGKDGAQPIGGVVLDPEGNFYGTTSLGGAFGNGTVFKETRSGHRWTESIIYNFTAENDPINPAAGVTLDPQGNLYGTASLGGTFGYGAVYQLSPSASGWTETVLYNFQNADDGANPVGGLVLDGAGNLYGSTFDGGVNGGGIVYEMSPSTEGWTFTILYSLTGGYSGPYNKLTLDGIGNIYGFTNGAGANGLGSVFKLVPANGGWTFTDLYDFVGGTTGGQPYGSVAVASDGKVFGTAVIGGSDNQGIVWEITP
jgi:uncharacterized repeat protein (TIGR03803 family)